MFHKESLKYLFHILFFIYLTNVKSNSINSATVLNINVPAYTVENTFNIIKLFVNQSGYHKIYNDEAEYISNMKINNITNTKYSELGKGIFYFPHENNVIELYFNSQINNLSNLFYSCSNITKIDFTNFDFSNIATMEGLFNGCSSLTSIEFGTFKSGNVKNMSYMFNDCISLKSLNLSNFKTSNVIDVQYMFHNCSSLTSLNLSNFNTKSLENMEAMFYRCIILVSLNLKNFNTHQVTKMNKTFEKCKSLENLDLSSFQIDNVINMSYMFYDCYKLNYIKFTNLNIDESTIIDNMLNNTSKKLEIYINSLEQFYEFYSDYNSQKECDNECNLDMEKKSCNLYTDSNINIFEEDFPEMDISEYLAKCKISFFQFYYSENSNKYLCTKYDKTIFDEQSLIIRQGISCQEIDDFTKPKSDVCPKYFNKSENEEPTYCIPNCPKELPFLLIYQAECVYNCTISERQNRKCITYYDFNAFDIIINQTKEELINNFNESVVDENKINEKNINISIISIGLEEKPEFSHMIKRDLSSNYADNYLIDFEQCIERLYNEGFLSENEKLFLLRVDVEQEGMHFPNFFYELYKSSSDDLLNILNLENCEDVKIIIDIYNEKLKENIDKYNLSSGFYNDICYTSKSRYNTDTILSRRQLNYIDYNMSVCGLNCEFIYYNNEVGESVCSCDVKTKIPFLKDIRFDKKILLNSFIKINNLMNLKMLKCYKNVFNKKNIIKNIGFYVFSILVILNIICVFLFYYKDYNKLFIEIEKLNLDYHSTSNKMSNKKDVKKIHKINIKIKKRKKKKKKNRINTTKLTKSLIIKKDDTTKNENIELNLKNENQLSKFEQKNINLNSNKKNKNRYKQKENTNLNYSELNSLKYEDAIKKDRRSYTQYYLSLLLTNHSLVCVFYSRDYNSKIIKLLIYIFNLASNIAVNALFFSDSTMDKIYINQGSYNIIYQISKIIYSSLISSGLNIIIKLLGLSESAILKIKNENDNKDKKEKKFDKLKLIKTLKIKFIFFFVFDFLFQITFWYYVTCFCSIYSNTQIFLFKDSLFSFLVSLITPFATYLMPGIFRISSLKNKNKCCYSISSALELL